MARIAIARQFGDIQDLELVDQPVTEPGAGQLRIAVRAAAINPADLKQLRGMFGRSEKSLPLRLGSEVSGVVTAVGPDVVGPAGPIAVGDEVVGYPVRGGFASELLVKASSVLPKPARLGWGEAAGLLVGAVTAFHLVEAVGLTEGDRVIVHGATGNVGRAVVQLARLRGAEVIGTVSAAHEEELRELGAVPVLYGPGLEERLHALLPRGADAALDTVGTDEALDASIALVSDRHRIATIAGFARGAELGIQLLGGGAGADPGTELRGKARLPLLTLAADGRLAGPPVISFPLEQVREAMTLVGSGHAGGKVVLLPEEPPDGVVRREWQTERMSADTDPNGTDPNGTDPIDTGANASGNQSDSAVTWDSVDSGQSEDIENSLTAQGTSDRETTREVSRDELVEEAERARLKRSGQV